MEKELVALAGDLVAERKKLSESLRRLEGQLLRGEPARALGRALGFDSVETLQAEIEALARGLERMGSLATTLIHNVNQGTLIPAGAFLASLAESIQAASGRHGRALVLESRGEEVLVSASTIERVEPAILRMAAILVEFAVETTRERSLRGKPEKAHFQLELKELEDSYRLLLVCDGNGIRPPLVEEHGLELARVGARANFDGKPGRWSAWSFCLPKETGMQRCLKVSSGGRQFYIPVWATLDELPEAEHGPVWRLDGELKRQEARVEPAQTVIEIGAGTEHCAFAFDSVGEPEEVILRPLHPALSAGERFTGVVTSGNELTLVLNPAYLACGEQGLGGQDHEG